ncbi:MAG: hypothetical protein ACR2PF_07020 [Rhizobiaceae bacterium]
MTVICPSCDARFRDPPAEVLANQFLQCGKCDHEWSLNRGRPVEIDAPAMVPDISDLIGEAQEPIRTALPMVVPQKEAEEAPVPIVPIYVDREEDPTGPSLFRGSLASISALALVAVVCSTIIFKDLIVAAVPQTAKYYETAGLETSNTGLKIANVVTTRGVKNGISQLIVKGEIANIADNTVPIPPIQLVMRGESEANLYEWTVAAAKNELKAGEMSRFTAVTKDYPKGAVNVEVTFAR